MDKQTPKPDLIPGLCSDCDGRTRRILATLPELLSRPFTYPGYSFMHRPLVSMVGTLAASYLYPQSSLYRNGPVLVAMERIASCMLDSLNPDGTINGVNHSSPPDTAFVVGDAGCLALVLAAMGMPGLESFGATLGSFLRKAGDPLLSGGVHTPNHRWVVTAALSYLHRLFGDRVYRERAEVWISEGIDIDGDGQFSERSSSIYSPVTVEALIRIAGLLDKPELLGIVRRHLDMILYYIRPDGRVDTLSSRRQDQGPSGPGFRYVLPYRFMAAHDRNGVFAAAAKVLEAGGLPAPEHVLLRVLEEPRLREAQPEPATLPDEYRRFFAGAGLVRIRRGSISASIFAGTDSPGPAVSGLSTEPTFFWFSSGRAILESVRIAPMFFSKGYFHGTGILDGPGGTSFSQTLSVSYFQPLSDEHKNANGRYGLTDAEGRFWSCMSFPDRATSQTQTLTISVSVAEVDRGFRLTISARECSRVPIAVELRFPPEGVLHNVKRLAADPFSRSAGGGDSDSVWYLGEGTGVYEAGGDSISFWPGRHDHDWIPAGASLPGQLVYLTFFSPAELDLFVSPGLR